MKILGIVTLYYPPENVVANIHSYLPYLDGLIIWDNTPQENILPFSKGKDGVVYIRKGENTGIGKALNFAANMLLSHSYTHLLTMDQDSCFMGDDFKRYKDVVSSYNGHHFMLFCPCRDKNLYKASSLKIEETQDTIISGALYPIETFQNIGLFKEDFVMDAIDTEFCLRIHRYNGSIGFVKSVFLNHKLGNPICRQFLWWKLKSFNYTPKRTYYIARNFLWIIRHYPEYNGRYILKLFIFRRFIRILCIENDKFFKLRALCHGIWDGLFKEKFSI
jgi:rhamnosyltransferase